MKKDLLFKILVIGDVSTGKSSVIRRYVHHIFEQHYKATVSCLNGTSLKSSLLLTTNVISNTKIGFRY